MTDDRFTRFPAALASRARALRIGEVPVLLAHPDWASPAPVMIWLHGRTVSKELDPGRYLRWIRAGIAACAIDLPGHGERLIDEFQHPQRTLDVLMQVLPEIDQVVEHLADPRYEDVFDSDRLGIGGMSAGGMAALRRLCEPHPFRCAAVEATTGDLGRLYSADASPPARPWPVRHDPARVADLDPARHLGRWRPIPLLAVHSEADRIIPFAGMSGFLEQLRAHYRSESADPAMIELASWQETGAPEEHLGFGRYSNDAKNRQTAFLQRYLLSGGGGASGRQDS